MFDLDPILLLPLALVLLLMALPNVSRQIYGRQRLVAAQELVNRLSDGEKPAIVDLRRPKQYAYSHVPTAINLDRDDLISKAKDRRTSAAKNLFNPETRLILVCESDLKSRKTARDLRKAGIDSVEVLEGGMFRWRRDGMPVRPKR